MPQKGKHEIVDLTLDDDDDGPPAKRQALSAAGSSRLNTTGGPRRAAPGSSQGSSQRPSATQEEDWDIDLTQDDDGPPVELYGTLHGKIVGINYYEGFASPGETVLCCREPQNQYDRNAIRVDNVFHQQIGHLPRKLVEKLAPYLDRGDIMMEAEISGRKGDFDCPVLLTFYGPCDPNQRTKIEAGLKADKLVRANELNRTKKEAEAHRTLTGLTNGGSTAGGLQSSADFEETPSVSLNELMQQSEAIESRKGGDAIKNLVIDEAYLEKMPKAEQPSQLEAQLLPYQLQGLAWMMSKEKPELPARGSASVVQLWKCNDQGQYWNAASEFVTRLPPKLLSGGILADDMGLGKTLQVISLILAGGPGPTLIVAPVSVMSNWEQQIRRHVRPGFMPKVHIYHGGEKKPLKELMTFDVVITSYGRVSREKDAGVGKVLSSPQAKWRRLVLDEGHTIRNARTKAATAACEVHAESRWVLTGTPIVNSVRDLQSLVRFLHITGGIENPEVFNHKITRRLGDGDGSAEALLQALMQDLCLRRKKDMKFIDLKLPPKSEYIHRITFRPEEKRKYDALLSEARGVLEEYQNRSDLQQKGRFQGVLERLLRLRQTCNHWTLCKQRIDDLMKLLEEQGAVELNDKNRALLQQALTLFIESQDDCAICYDTPTSPVITNCKHVFCRRCIAKAIELQHKCPMCRNPLNENQLLEPLPEAAEDDGNFDADTQSSKTEAIMQIINATSKNPGSKIVVFSQWTSFLNIVQAQLTASGVRFARIDGSMNTDKRDRAIHALDTDSNTRVLLASLAVCSVGLNLVSADTVILSDSWWAPAIEDQAIDRVHRLGQKNPTTVWRLVMEDTVEERVLSIQHEKRQLVNKAFQEKDKKDKQAKVTRMGDITKLLA